MAGQWIEISAADGSGTFRGYLASPASGKGPAIVLCQEIFGINEYIRDVADYYAEEGYVVLAPDLFWRIKPGIELGYSEQDWKQAFGLFEKFDTDGSGSLEIAELRWNGTSQKSLINRKNHYFATVTPGIHRRKHQFKNWRAMQHAIHTVRYT